MAKIIEELTKTEKEVAMEKLSLHVLKTELLLITKGKITFNPNDYVTNLYFRKENRKKIVEIIGWSIDPSKGTFKASINLDTCELISFKNNELVMEIV